MVDGRMDLLLILDVLLDIFAVAEREDFKVRFRWVRRCFIQNSNNRWVCRPDGLLALA